MYISIIVRNSFHFKTYSFNLGDNPIQASIKMVSEKMEISMPAMNETFERVSQRNKRLTGGKPEKRVEATRYRVSTFSLCPLAVAFRELTSIIFLGAAYPK